VDGSNLARRIDYAFLKVDSRTRVDALREAVQTVQNLGLRCLCVPPVLAGTVKKNFPQLRVCAVVSYPLGSDSLAAKTFILQELIEQQIDEVDVVYDLFALVNDNRRKIELEAQRLGELTASAQVFHKAIIETPILSEEQIRWAAEILRQSPVDCVKTSTGYGREPTSLDHVRLIRNVVGHEKQIKASGGIANLYLATSMLDAGADILGTSHPIRIMDEVGTTKE
jgi:deoxyribose-phosphate aldolase